MARATAGRVRLGVEGLEGRAVPAVLTPTLANGTLAVRTDNVASRLTVLQAGGAVSVRDDAAGRQWSFPAAAVARVTITAGVGADAVDTQRLGAVPVTAWLGFGNDSMYAGAGDDTVFGGDGSDTVYDAGGNNRIDGGNGNDDIRCAGLAGNDTLIGGAGNDYLGSSAYGNDEFSGGAGNDILGGGDRATVYGGEGNDWLTGGKTASWLYGQAGNDRLDAGGGTNYLDGGAGNDVLDALNGSANDTLIGGAGVDYFYVDKTPAGGTDRLADRQPGEGLQVIPVHVG